MKKTQLNKAGRRYLRQVRRLLPCSHKTKESILARLSQSVEAFLDERPDADAAAFQQRFGKPEAVAAMYVENAEMPELLRGLQIRRRVLAIVIATALLILIGRSALLLHAKHKVDDMLSGYGIIKLYDFTESTDEPVAVWIVTQIGTAATESEEGD